MEIASVKGELRKTGGHHANERLRRSGLLPAVIYGHGEAPESVAVSQHDVVQALGRLAHVIALQVDGKSTQYLLKQVQYDHLQKDPIHVDLMRVDPNERIKVKIPVELKGTPVGVRNGGELSLLIPDLEIECRLLEIPGAIVVNVAELDLNHAVHVRELQLPEGVKAIPDPEAIVAQVKLKKLVVEAAAVVAPVEGATAAEPEVIGRVAKEEPAEEKGKEKEKK